MSDKYGNEWRLKIMRLGKSAIVEMLRDVLMKIDELPQSPPVVDATFSTVDAMCERCGWGPHTVTSVGALDIQVCNKCKIGWANQ